MKEKILVLDNYDSFTYNIIHLIKSLTAHTIDVRRNTSISLEEIYAYKKILLSPGPCTPSESHILKPLIKYFAAIKSILGVCLGEQAIADVFGGKLINPANVYHGFSSKITIVDSEEKLFDNLPTYITVGRYHSWVVSECNFPLELKITARGPKGEIMALRHKYYDVVGVQFHPESILTPTGVYMLYNWLHLQK
ncbi:anthranilate synthase component II [Candidatus Uzinura diaspidicola str. ASNER]|uniref:Anthranilate synthase component II n=1 Tax=Candidatus Uzinura diaspidicola str. ASNER TaxID=1133592 RepID=L7VK10_9FLAO|nr:anthranilate synthase component II [Candidatus Uzinura diaspidicola str. ASNER]